MAVMAGVFNETQRRTLEAFCDTIVPAVEYDGSDEAMRAFMSRSAADMAIAAQIEDLMAEALMPEDIAGFAGLLDALAGERLRLAAARGAHRRARPGVRLGTRGASSACIR